MPKLIFRVLGFGWGGTEFGFGFADTSGGEQGSSEESFPSEFT